MHAIGRMLLLHRGSHQSLMSYRLRGKHACIMLELDSQRTLKCGSCMRQRQLSSPALYKRGDENILEG